MQELKKKGIMPAVGIFTAVAVVAVLFVIVGIMLTFGADITQSIGEEQEVNSYARNISDASLAGQEELGSWQDNWAMIIAVVVIISLLGLALGAVLMYVRT